MPGSTSFSPYPIPLDGSATPIAVYRYDHSREAGSRLTGILPNVRCTQVQWFDGAHPPAARFEYVFDDSDPSSTYPDQFEDVWPLGATGPYVVQNDDELVVMAFAPNGTKRCLFYGFAQIPQVDLTSQSQSVTFVATGVAIRLWDVPIGGATYRNATDPSSMASVDQVPTDERTHFNPSLRVNGNPTIQPNCTPDSNDVNEGTGTAYPVFLDPNIQRSPDLRTYWTLAKMTRYLLMVYNGDEKYVKNPDTRTLEALLDVYAPTSGDFYNPNDPGQTYTVNPIPVRDFDATNMAWPDAIASQIERHGFSFHFVIDTDENDEPVNSIEFFRKDTKSPYAPKSLYLQQLNAILDPGQTNVHELHVVRDNHPLVNRFVIETRPVLYEVSVILAPGFSPTLGDETNSAQFLLSALTTATSTVRNKYRRYVVDEVADGHWDFATSTWKTTAFDFSTIFGKPKVVGNVSIPQYVQRTRPGRDTLISVDSASKPYKAQLAYSWDYTGKTAGKCPAFWDNTGTWFSIDSGWRLLTDRLGIMVTIEDVEGWTANKVKLNGVTSLANPTMGTATASRLFFLRLTTVIEGDTMLKAVAEKRAASPSRFAITRRIEARDHFQQQVLAPHSLFNTTATAVTDPTTGKVRDDSAVALAHAQAMRSAHEFPPLAGSVAIPRLTLAYSTGNRLNLIQGRDVSLVANVGTGNGEAPEYPWVESVTWHFDGDRQMTTLHLSDRRAEPQRA